jgi:hypothetical protein
MPGSAIRWWVEVACPHCAAAGTSPKGGLVEIAEGRDLDGHSGVLGCPNGHEGSLREGIMAAAVGAESEAKCPEGHPTAPLRPDVPEKPPQAWLCPVCGRWRRGDQPWEAW